MKATNSHIGILMSAYNGEKYIAEQINSIINQTYSNWVLYIRDDGSNDGTLDIIKSFVKKDSRIHLLPDSIKHRGVRDSFLYLLQKANVDYYMFCDQDDVWYDDKIEVSLSEIIHIEKTIEPNLPVMVCSDLAVVDASLNIIHPSLWEQNHVKTLLNNVRENINIAPLFPGCTMLFNNIAKKIALSYPPHDKTIHDNHLALSIIANDGVIKPIQKALIQYRQHSNNVMGTYRGSHFIRSKFSSLLKVINQNRNQFQIIKYYLQTPLKHFLALKLKHLFNYS